jgi:hypothetical protein
MINKTRSRLVLERKQMYYEQESIRLDVFDRCAQETVPLDSNRTLLRPNVILDSLLLSPMVPYRVQSHASAQRPLPVLTVDEVPDQSVVSFLFKGLSWRPSWTMTVDRDDDIHRTTPPGAGQDQRASERRRVG